jgi:hypothetical protein
MKEGFEGVKGGGLSEGEGKTGLNKAGGVSGIEMSGWGGPGSLTPSALIFLGTGGISIEKLGFSGLIIFSTCEGLGNLNRSSDGGVGTSIFFFLENNPILVLK